LGLFSCTIAQKEQIETLTNKEYESLFGLYKHLHQNPELSFHEEQTGKRMAEELKKAGFKVTSNFGGYGVVGVMKNGKGPTIMVRTDLDALPVKEESGVAYESKIKTKDDTGKEVSVMHACGHDMHMTAWVGTARVLSQMKKEWKGTLIFIGQPAEERGGGAKAMLGDGLYDKFPQPDYALALHVSSSLPAGTVGYCEEYAMANVDMVDITVYGRGGHGAYPHTTIDPVVLASRIVLDLQTIVSREISPLEPAVVTVGSIHGGTKGNVIPDEVKLELTVRSYTDEVRNQLLGKIKRISEGAAITAGVTPDMYPKIKVRDEYTPSLYNDPALSQNTAKAIGDMIGGDNVKVLAPVMGGEDFARYGREKPKVPIMLYWLGAVEPEKIAAAERGEIALPSLHSPKFAPTPEVTIKTGVQSMSAAVMNLLNP